jgi:hypothetical protein
MAYRSVDFVGVVPKKQRTQNRVGKRVVHPLKIQQPGVFSEKRLRSIDDEPGELVAYSEWKDQQSFDA